MSESPLPSPDARPKADVVVYDGDCRVCTRQVRHLARWDGRGRLAFLSLHDPAASRRYPQLPREQLLEQMHVIDRHGQVHRGAGAFRYLTRRLPRLWVLAPLLHIPFTLPLWQWLYRQFAKRRYWFGRAAACDDEACHVHFR